MAWWPVAPDGLDLAGRSRISAGTRTDSLMADRRPHQSLNMAFPVARFTAPAADGLGLRIPAELTRKLQPPAGAEEPEPDDRAAAPPPPGPGSGSGHGKAVELDRVVPPSGNLWIAGQQVWPGPAMTGRTVRLWAGLSQVHVLLDGHRIKTLPSRPGARDLARLTTPGRRRLSRPARGPPPAPRRPPRHRPAAPVARTPGRHTAGLGPRVDHGRRPEDPSWPGPCP